jgi:hypothetical protein
MGLGAAALCKTMRRDDGTSMAAAFSSIVAVRETVSVVSCHKY